MRKLVLAVAVAAGLTAAGTEARAQVGGDLNTVGGDGSSASGSSTSSASNASSQDIFRRGTRPGFFSLGTGPGVGIAFINGGAGFLWNIDLAAGYHFSGNSGGPMIGGEIQMSIPFGAGFQMTFAGRFTYDIHVAGGFYVGPTASLGLGFVAGGGAAGFALRPSLGVDLKFILGDRGLLFVRPINFGFPVWAGGNSLGGSGALGFFEIDFVNFGGGVTF